MSSYAKQTLDVSLAGYYERSRLARVSDTTSNFSLTSNAGWRGELTIDKYFTNWWVLSLAGNYASHNYEGSAARIINDPQPSLAGGEGGFKFVFGDFRFYMLYNYQPLIILVDEAVYIHDLKQVGMGSGILGFEFSAISRYWDLAFEAKGGMGLSEVDYEGTAVKHQYMVEGAAMIIFGRTNKTLFEVISLKNIIGNDSLFGLKVSVREDSYSFGDDKYTLTNFRAGGFLKFIF
ncbi:MAG: hypothetical protein KDD34_02780 [Bdellovibrionales bacterium]|nr:hypothetical protein [Bdellovibrionales bacterium]